MLTIYKYVINGEPGEAFRVPMPGNAELLDVQMQHGRPVLWALVDTDQPVGEGCRFVVYGTGAPVNPALSLKYVGTFQVNEGIFVWHLFEVLS